MDWIQGEKFIGLANNVDIFYRHTHNVNSFFENLSISTDFVLISHNSDGCITENPKRAEDADFRLMPSNLIMWYGQNVNIGNDKIKSLPIGVENNKWVLKARNLEKMTEKLERPKEVKNLVYMNHKIDTNPNERTEPYQLFKNESWVTTIYGWRGYKFDEYIDNVYNHKFVICPEGNGIDTVRTWECLYMGTIPIEKRNINNQFYTDLPICFVDNWNQITENFLLEKCERIKALKWNMDKLKFSYWANKINRLKNRRNSNE